MKPSEPNLAVGFGLSQERAERGRQRAQVRARQRALPGRPHSKFNPSSKEYRRRMRREAEWPTDPGGES